MTKKEFIDELKEELNTLSKEEKASAVKYYEDYFEDAGEENEQEVIKELGTPHKVAEAIKKESNTNNVKEEKVDNNVSKNHWPLWLIIVIILLATPIGLPIVIGILGTIFGITMGIIGVMIGIVSAGIGIFVSGIGLSVFGLITAFTNAANGLLLLGIGFILIGVGVLSTFLIIKLFILIIPPIVRGIVDLCKLPFRNRGASI